MQTPPRQNIADIASQFRSSRPYVMCTVTGSVLILGLLAKFTHEPLIVPPLGPTIFIVFAFPMAQEAQPRNIILGHLVGVLAGMAALYIFGLVNVDAHMTEISNDRLAAITLGVFLAVFTLATFRILHIPALATVLLVSMGLLNNLQDWVAIMVGVLIVVSLGLIINRGFGMPMPFWSRRLN